MSMYMQNNSELVEIPSGGGSGNSHRMINLYDSNDEVVGFAICFQNELGVCLIPFCNYGNTTNTYIHRTDIGIETGMVPIAYTYLEDGNIEGVGYSINVSGSKFNLGTNVQLMRKLQKIYIRN